MCIESLHPGVNLKEVIEKTGFELLIPEEVPVTPEPTEKELDLIRNIVDPNGELLQGKMGGSNIRK